MGNRRRNRSMLRSGSWFTRLALKAASAVVILGCAAAHAEAPYTLVGGWTTGLGDSNRSPTYVVGDSGVARYEAGVNSAASTSQLGASVVRVLVEDALPPDVYSMENALTFAVISDHFIIVDLDDPHFTGTLGTDLWLISEPRVRFL